MDLLLKLFTTRRFLPLLLTQFQVAFNDNMFKNAMLLLIMYGGIVRADAALSPALLVTLASGLFILPYVLFSALAGQFADAFEKSRLVRIIKLCEIVLMVSALLGFVYGSLPLLFTVLFLTGVQSAFFSPLKYSLVPEYLREEEVLGGNGLLAAFSFLAILLGTIAGGLLINKTGGAWMVGGGLIALSLMGYVCSRALPLAPPHHITLDSASAAAPRIDYRLHAQTIAMLRMALGKRMRRLTIMGIGWFWFIGTVFFSQFPLYTQQVLDGNEEVVTLLLTAFSIGIALGSVISQKLLKGRATSRYVPHALFALSLIIADLYYISDGLAGAELIGARAFLAQWHNVRVLMDIMLIAVCGGLVFVPLNALLQLSAQPSRRARIIAAANITDAGFMLLASLVVASLLAGGVYILDIFALLAVVNAFVALYALRVVRGR